MADVLIIDDSPTVALYVYEVLSELGHRVRHAAGRERLEAELRQGPPDLVLLDLRVPGLPAEVSLDMLRRSGVDAGRIRIHSGLPTDCRDGATEELCVGGHLPKGLAPDEFASRVDALLSAAPPPGGGELVEERTRDGR